MSIAKVKLDESTKLAFGVTITGAEGTPTARFVIEGRDFSLMFPCNKLEEGGIEVMIDEMGHILKAGEYPVRLEVVIENKIFTPMEDTIIFEPSVEVFSKPKAVEHVKEAIQVDQVVVTVDTSKKQKREKDIKLATLIAEALGQTADPSQTPTQIINESLANKPRRLAKDKKNLVLEMLKTARENQIEFDSKLLGK